MLRSRLDKVHEDWHIYFFLFFFTLWGEFNLQLSGKVLLLEEFVLADVATDHALDLTSLKQQSEPEVVDAGVVADTSQVLCAFLLKGCDEGFWDATETKPTD